MNTASAHPTELFYVSVATSGLELCGGRVSDRGLVHVGKLSSLERLNLSQNHRVSTAGLAKLSGLQRLEALNVSHCKVREAMASSHAADLRGDRPVWRPLDHRE
jgi:Leucine-rich repeat (LRR) protein